MYFILVLSFSHGQNVTIEEEGILIYSLKLNSALNINRSNNVHTIQFQLAKNTEDTHSFKYKFETSKNVYEAA